MALLDFLFGSSGDGGRVEEERLRKKREAELARNRAQIDALFGITDPSAYDIQDPFAQQRKEAEDRLKNTDDVAYWRQQLDMYGPAPDTSGLLEEAKKNKAAREKMLFGEDTDGDGVPDTGGYRADIMDYFMQEIDKRKKRALDNIQLTMAARGRSIVPAYSELMNDYTDVVAEKSKRADSILRSVVEADDRARRRLRDSLNETGDVGASIADARRALETNVNKISEMQNAERFNDLFSRIDEIYGQRGARDAYNQGRRYARRAVAPGVDEGGDPLITEYGV